jgi:hypothetical protein
VEERDSFQILKNAVSFCPDKSAAIYILLTAYRFYLWELVEGLPAPTKIQKYRERRRKQDGDISAFQLREENFRF